MSLFRNLFIFSIFFSAIYAQDFKSIAPKEVPSKADEGQIIQNEWLEPREKGTTLITSHLKGLILVGSPEDVVFEGRVEVQGVEFFNLDVPGNPQELQELLTDQAIGKPLTIDDVSAIKSTISTYYRNHHRPVVVVLALKQKVKHQTLQLVVLESCVDQVFFTGNEWFRSSVLRRYVHLKKGSKIDSQQLARDLEFMNRNPFRVTNAILRPGQERGTTDIEFQTHDRFPFRFYGGGDNTGIESTGSGRLFIGFNWGDALLQDQLLSYQYTTSTEFGRFYAHTADWKIPLPWKHLIHFFGGYSRIRPKMSIKGMRNKGEAYQVSGRYVIPLPSARFYLHDIVWGADYKHTNTNLVFSDLTLIGSSVIIAQCVLGYEGQYKRAPFTVDLEGHWFISPGDIFPNQTDQAYQTLRAGAESTYTYLRTRIASIFDVNFGSIAIDSRLQLSSSNLLSSEQFGLGGLYTVRGYEERDLNTDNAFMFSIEWRTPTLHVFHHPNFKKLTDDLKFYLFLDYGVGWNHKRSSPEVNTFLLGVGPGMRYVLSPYLSCRVDWGVKLHQPPDVLSDKPLSRVYFSIIGSF